MDIIDNYFPGLDDRRREAFAALKGIYEDWNAKINVISRKDMDEFYLHHVLHSLSVAAFFRFADGASVIDIGCGGGFPDIPLAIMFPEVSFTAVDSIGKKIRVVESVAAELGLKNVRALNCRAEQLPAGERFDFAVSRAVTAFPAFVNIAKGTLRRSHGMAHRIDGDEGLRSGIIYLKGGDFDEELAAFPKADVMNIGDIFREEFFSTKKIIYLPI